MICCVPSRSFFFAKFSKTGGIGCLFFGATAIFGMLLFVSVVSHHIFESGSSLLLYTQHHSYDVMKRHSGQLNGVSDCIHC